MRGLRVGAREKTKRHALASNRRDSGASPRTSNSELTGSFSDVEHLLDQLGKPAVIELGKPLPDEKYLPRKRAGSCHATHNDALIGS